MELLPGVFIESLDSHLASMQASMQASMRASMQASMQAGMQAPGGLRCLRVLVEALERSISI